MTSTTRSSGKPTLDVADVVFTQVVKDKSMGTFVWTISKPKVISLDVEVSWDWAVDFDLTRENFASDEDYNDYVVRKALG